MKQPEHNLLLIHQTVPSPGRNTGKVAQAFLHYMNWNSSAGKEYFWTTQTTKHRPECPLLQVKKLKVDTALSLLKGNQRGVAVTA